MLVSSWQKKDGAKEWPRRKLCFPEIPEGGRLTLGLGLRKTDGALAFFPFAALFHELDAFEALHD